MKKNKEYLTTGEFAELFGVKKQTMFHYDQMGIFCPEILGENGYRYYSHNQLEAFSIILMLRETGLSIGEIKKQIDKHSPEDLVELLEVRRKEIDGLIDHLEWSREYIGRKIATTKEGISIKDGKGGLRCGEIFIQDLPDEVMIMTEYQGPADPRAVNEAIGDHYRYLTGLGMNSRYPDGATIPRNSVVRNEKGTDYRYGKFYTILTEREAERLLNTGKFPEGPDMDSGGRFLAIYDCHGYANVGACLAKLLDYAEDHGMKLGDSFYEDVIWDDLSCRDYEEYLIKLSIRIL